MSSGINFARLSVCMKQKYMILLYATEACPLLMRDKHSLEFTVTRVFMKIFRTGTPTVVAECQRIFNFLPVEVQLEIRTAKFLQTFSASEKYTVCIVQPDCNLAIGQYVR